MTITNKKFISENELLLLVQDALKTYPVECRNIQIKSLQPYPEQHDGANWNVINYGTSGKDHDLEDCKSKIAAEINKLRSIYEVKK